MSRQIILQILRAPDNATRLTLIPEDGEFIYQKDTEALYIGDGDTPGGLFLALIGSAAPLIDGANIGVSGVGPYKGVTGTTIEFKNLNAGSAKVTITNDSPNDEIDIDIVPAQILTSLLNNDEGWLNESDHDSLPNDNPHNVSKSQVGLGNADNTSDINKPVSTAQQAALDLKYDASNPNNYETPAQLDARDIANRARANHTGTQLSSTISDFAATVRSTLLTGYTVGANVVLSATDTVLQAFEKLQGQINALVYGREYEYWSSEGINTTTSANYQPKLNVSTAPLTIGRRYKIEWYAEHLNLGSTSQLSDVEVQIDGAQVGQESVEKEDNNDNYVFSGMFEYTAVANASINLDMNFREINGGTARIKRARLNIRRVA